MVSQLPLTSKCKVNFFSVLIIAVLLLTMGWQLYPCGCKKISMLNLCYCARITHNDLKRLSLLDELTNLEMSGVCHRSGIWIDPTISRWATGEWFNTGWYCDGNKSLYLIFVGAVFFSASWTVFRAVRTASWTAFRAVRTAASWLFC
jgi:hypothetical protein